MASPRPFQTEHGYVDPAAFTVRTKRLLLRPMVIEDAPDIFQYRKEESVIKWTSGSTTNTHPRETLAWMSGRLRANHTLFAPHLVIEVLDSEVPSPITAESSPVYTYKYSDDSADPAIVNEDRVLRIVGTLASHRPPEIGYMLNPRCWGRGYASEALAGFLELFWVVTPRPRVAEPISAALPAAKTAVVPEIRAEDATEAAAAPQTDEEIEKQKIEEALELKRTGGWDFAEGYINPVNLASQRVLTKCGFELVEIREHDVCTPMMGWMDTGVYRLRRPGV